MSTADTFSVILDETIGATDLTPFVTNLGFRSVDPGGFGSVTFDLARGLDKDDFEPFAQILVYDAETGEQVGGGRLLGPGRGIDTAGNEVWKMEALGEGVAHLQERKQPYALIDETYDNWHSGRSTSTKRKWEKGDMPDDDVGGLLFAISTPAVGDNAFTNCDYYMPNQIEQEIAGYAYHYTAGRNDGNSIIQSKIRNSLQTGDFLEVSNDWFVTGDNWKAFTVTDDWDPNDWTPYWMNLCYVRNGYYAMVVEDDWVHVNTMCVKFVRLNRNRQSIYTAADYFWNRVYGHEVIIDALARFCPRLDLVNARIDTSTFEHTQLMWLDGITAYDVLDYIRKVEPAFTWAVWEKQDNALWRFEWKAKPTDVRYEIPPENFSLTGGEEQRLSKIWYTGKTSRDRYLAEPYEEIDPILSALDIVPTDTQPVDTNLTGMSWEPEVAEIGGSAIENSKLRATSAKVNVSGKVYDRFLGRWVKPYKVLPGYLCRVPLVHSQHDTLNDGVVDTAAIFRITTNDYKADSGESSLELNAYTVDELRAIAELMNPRMVA